MIAVTVAAVLMMGLVLDGGVLLRARSDAFSTAAAAARVGAQQLDPVTAVDGDTVLDPIAAQNAALDYLDAHGVTGHVTVTGNTVTVSVTTQAHFQILRTVGANTVSFNATATAQAIKVNSP
jgi:hypothetical protein